MCNEWEGEPGMEPRPPEVFSIEFLTNQSREATGGRGSVPGFPSPSIFAQNIHKGKL